VKCEIVNLISWFVPGTALFVLALKSFDHILGVGGGHLLKVQLLQSRLSSKSNLTNLTKPKLKSDFLQSEIMLRNGVSKDHFVESPSLK
jgi:hypothetical protein